MTDAPRNFKTMATVIGFGFMAGVVVFTVALSEATPGDGDWVFGVGCSVVNMSELAVLLFSPDCLLHGLHFSQC